VTDPADEFVALRFSLDSSPLIAHDDGFRDLLAGNSGLLRSSGELYQKEYVCRSTTLSLLQDPKN
jgi:hypothetical protein